MNYFVAPQVAAFVEEKVTSSSCAKSLPNEGPYRAWRGYKMVSSNRPENMDRECLVPFLEQDGGFGWMHAPQVESKSPLSR